MTEVRNDTTGELIGMAQYDADGKLHGRAYNFHSGTQTIHEDHNYLHGTRHGECTTHFGPRARRVDHYDHGRLTHKEIIEEFERYIVRTVIPWEDGSIEKKKTRLPKKKFSEWLSSKQN